MIDKNFLESNTVDLGLILYLKQGGIYINPKNKGKFTKKANRAGYGVQEYARHVLANKDDYPASTIKQANFARNFGGRKKK